MVALLLFLCNMFWNYGVLPSDIPLSGLLPQWHWGSKWLKGMSKIQASPSIYIFDCCTSEKLPYFGKLIRGNTPAFIQWNAHSEVSCKSVTLGTKVLPAFKCGTIWYCCIQDYHCYFTVIHGVVVKYLFKTMLKLRDKAFMVVALKLLNILLHDIRNTTDFTLFKQDCTY